MALFLSGCKKDKPEVIEITFYEPATGFTSSFGSAVSVHAKLKASSVISSVSIAIVDQSLVPVSDPVILFPGKNELEIRQDIVPDNNYLPSGNYNVEIAVKTSMTFTHAHRTIYLSATPRTTEAFIILTASDSLSFNVFRRDSSLHLLKNVSGDYVGSSISSRYRMLYSAGRYTGSIQSLNLDSLNINFSIPPDNPLPLPSFTATHFSSELFYAGHYNGAIKAYDQTGQLRYDTANDAFYYPVKFSHNNDYVIAGLLSHALNERYLAAFFYPSGVRRQLLFIDSDIVELFPFTADETLVFARRNGHALIYKYSVSQNNLNLIKDAGVMNLHGVKKVNDNEYLLATGQGIVHYRYDWNSAATVSSFACYSIAHDEINNQYLCAAANEVRIMQAGTFATSETIQTVDSILAVGVFYNK